MKKFPILQRLKEITTKIGNVGNTDLQTQVTTLNSNFNTLTPVTRSVTNVPSGVSLRNASVRKSGKVVAGYVEVSVTNPTTTQTIGTLSNEDVYPQAKIWFPAFSNSSADYMGFIDITTDGVITYHPTSGLTGTKTVSASICYVTA